MWKVFHFNEDLFMTKIQEDGDHTTVHLTDLNEIWEEQLPKESLLLRFQDCNPLIEVKVEEATEQVTTMINSISDENEFTNIEINEDNIKLSIKRKVSETTVNFFFSFTKKDRSLFLKNVTIPLIQTVKHLEEQQKMLCNLIQKKDRELEEYRMEKGNISRSDLITEVFDPNVLKLNGGMLNVFNHETFWNNLLQKHGEIPLKTLKVTVDPWNQRKKIRKVYSAKNVKKKGVGVVYKN